MCFGVVCVVLLILTHAASAQALQGQTSESHANLRLCGASRSLSDLCTSLFFAPLLLRSESKTKTQTLHLYFTVTRFCFLYLNLAAPPTSFLSRSSVSAEINHQGPHFFGRKRISVRSARGMATQVERIRYILSFSHSLKRFY